MYSSGLLQMNPIAENTDVPGNIGNRRSVFDKCAKNFVGCDAASRSVLLGSRGPRGPCWVPVIKSGQIDGGLPTNLGDYDGGPGTTLAFLYFGDRLSCKTPVDDFNWHQGQI